MGARDLRQLIPTQINIERSQTPVGPASRARFPTVRTFEHLSQPNVRSLTDVLPVGDDEMVLMKGGT